ncbi:MAG TPA: carboxypeptidase regulatory-like domain-containing protein [Candidatus Solibacter sp.]|nr:carboxypeptidase regulatory-like domain-containing protein [Candidatus Solibacter sp.]
MKTWGCLVFLCVGLTAPALYAQFEYGEVLGTVRDQSGGVITGAKITLREIDTNVERSVLTNDQGNYSFPGLRAGNYEIATLITGFRPAKSDTLLLRVSDRLRFDLQLTPGQVNETVTVTAEASPLLETEISSRGQTIQGQQIRELPLNKRDYTQLVLLAPGSTYNPAQRLGGAISINGNRTLQNNYLLDGADNNSNTTSFRGERVDVIRPSVDAVEEFRVLTNSYSAEYGRSAGAVVNVSIKGGSNRLRGTAWEFFRNDKMDAHGWTPTLGGVKPELRFNLFGANMGGPIVKDKTFFFVNYEGERERNGVTYQGTVPTLDLQAGDFSNIAPGLSSTLRIIPVDPANNRVPFAGNIIPKNRWSRAATLILADPNFPAPTPTPLIPVPGTHIATVTNRNRSDKFDIRIDHQVSSRWRMFGRYSFSDLEGFRPARYKGYVEGSDNDAYGTTATRGQNAVFGNTLNLNSTSLLEIRAAYTRLGANVFPPNFGSPSPGKLLGIPNLPDSPSINGGWSKFSITGINAFGSTTSTPQYQIPNVYLLSGVLSLQRGAHTLRTGIDGQYIQTAILDVSALRGTFTFSNNVWSNNPWADFLLGLPAAYTQTSLNVLYNRKQIYNAFIQDDYHVLSNLTLNLGLRYEFSTPIYEKNNHLANFDINTGQLYYAKDGSLSDRALVDPDTKNFAPRVGLAWTAMNKLVVRSGYGIFYNHTNRQGREGLMGMNRPFVYDLTRSQAPGASDVITLDGGPPPNFFATSKPADQIARGNDPHLRNGMVQQWNFTLQYAFARDWVFEAGYVGNRGLHLTRFWNANQARLPGPPTDLTVRRPYPTFADVQYMDAGGSSYYNALQTRLEKRFSRGFTMLHAFTWSRGIENIGAWNDPNGSLTPQNAYDFRAEKALAGNTVKFNSVTNWVYYLPFGKGQPMMNAVSPLVNAVLGNWEFDGIWNWRSGLPLTITSASCGANCNMGGQRYTRADVVPGVSPSVDDPSATLWFNKAAFAPQAGPYGTVGKNTVWGPGLQQWDLTMAKNFRIGEDRSIQFRGELFNAFNQVNYNPPDGNVSNATFGRITSALSGRSVQFGLKMYW